MNAIATRLTRDHEELDALLTCLVQDAEAPSACALEASWDLFERRLIHHMEAEERFLLPLVEASNGAEVARTRTEHIQIRDMIAELGLAIELHAVRASDIRKLSDLLREHAKHEDEALYQLAGDKASVAVGHDILDSLKAALHAVVTSATPNRADAARGRART